MIAEIGEFQIISGDKEINLKPTLERMLQIGNGKELIGMFAILHGQYEQAVIKQADVFSEEMTLKRLDSAQKEVLMIALDVLNTCADCDVDEVVGYFNEDFEYVEGVMPKQDVVIIAQSLMQHGIIGKHKMKNAKGDGNYTQDLDLMQFISLARAHLGFSDKESRNLSMTELLKIIDEKQNDGKASKRLTAEEYEEIKASYLESKARLAQRIKENPDLNKPAPRGMNK